MSEFRPDYFYNPMADKPNSRKKAGVLLETNNVELITRMGLKLRAIENVRILGPVRKASQVEGICNRCH